MVVLATNVYVQGEARERALDSLDALVDDAVGDLAVRWDVGLRDDGFPSVTLTGPDATAARNVLGEQWGEITPHLEPGKLHTGTLERWDDGGVVLDAGQPVRVPTDGLGLGPGTPSQIRKRHGLVQHIPLEFVAGAPSGAPATNSSGGGTDEETDSTDGAVDWRLSDGERDRLYGWMRGPGRVNVNSATRAEVRATVNRAGHAQDIVTVERLGLLEQSIVCQPDTDPPGLLASIGEYLPSELLAVVP